MKAVVEYRVRVIPQFPPEDAEAELNELAGDGFAVLLCQPTFSSKMSAPMPEFGGLMIQVPAPALYCVFVRAKSLPLPGDEWKGDDDDGA